MQAAGTALLLPRCQRQVSGDVMVEIAIRQFKESDAKEFQAAVLESVEHLSAWLPWCTPDYSIQDATDWAHSASQSWRDGTDYRFLVEDAKTGQILGVGRDQSSGRSAPERKPGLLGSKIRHQPGHMYSGCSSGRFVCLRDPWLPTLGNPCTYQQ
jgi:hypothetical protein